MHTFVTKTYKGGGGGQRSHVYLNHTAIYYDKRKQLLKMKFLVNEQNVSAMFIDINAILYLDLNIFQQDECFCSKLEIEVHVHVEYAESIMKTLLSQIWVLCRLLPFVSVGQHTHVAFLY